MSRERKRKAVSDDFIVGDEEEDDSGEFSGEDEPEPTGDEDDALSSDASDEHAKAMKKDKKGSSKKKDKKSKKEKSKSKSKSSKKPDKSPPAPEPAPSKKIRIVTDGRKSGKAVKGAVATAASTKAEEEVPGEDVSGRSLPFKRARSVPKRRMWKNLKQILKAERYHLVPTNLPTYENIAVPPSLLPVKKYCDITGLPAPYTHPRTKIRYANLEVYQVVAGMTDERVQQYLAPRGATYHTRAAVLFTWNPATAVNSIMLAELISSSVASGLTGHEVELRHHYELAIAGGCMGSQLLARSLSDGFDVLDASTNLSKAPAASPCAAFPAWHLLFSKPPLLKVPPILKSRTLIAVLVRRKSRRGNTEGPLLGSRASTIVEQYGEGALPESRVDKKREGICVEKGCYFDIREPNATDRTLRPNGTPSTCVNCCELNRLRQRRLRASKRAGKPSLTAKKEEQAFKKIRNDTRLGTVAPSGVDAMPVHHASAHAVPELAMQSHIAGISSPTVGTEIFAVQPSPAPPATAQPAPDSVNTVQVPAAAMPPAAAAMSSLDVSSEFAYDVANFYASEELFPAPALAEVRAELGALRVEVLDIDGYLNWLSDA